MLLDVLEDVFPVNEKCVSGLLLLAADVPNLGWILVDPIGPPGEPQEAGHDTSDQEQATDEGHPAAGGDHSHGCQGRQDEYRHIGRIASEPRPLHHDVADMCVQFFAHVPHLQ